MIAESLGLGSRSVRGFDDPLDHAVSLDSGAFVPWASIPNSAVPIPSQGPAEATVQVLTPGLWLTGPARMPVLTDLPPQLIGLESEECGSTVSQTSSQAGSNTRGTIPTSSAALHDFPGEVVQGDSGLWQRGVAVIKGRSISRH